LLISGPNEGRNVGFAVFVSGTLGAAHASIVNNVPAIAVSAGSTPTDSTQAKAYAQLVATKVLDIVSELEKTKKTNEAILPPKMGLNINFPDYSVLSSSTEYKFTEVNWSAGGANPKYGSYPAYGVTLGLVFGADISGDTDKNSEGIASTDYITISTIDATENAPKAKSSYTAYRLNELVK
jgi:5'-nucleotidase